MSDSDTLKGLLFSISPLVDFKNLTDLANDSPQGQSRLDFDITDMIPGKALRVNVGVYDIRIYNKGKPETFNQKQYREKILEWIPDIALDDLNFLCNKAGALHQKLRKVDDRVDNFRICRKDLNHPSAQRFMDCKSHGYCGTVNETYTNPMTVRSFMIGFNYGYN